MSSIELKNGYCVIASACKARGNPPLVPWIATRTLLVRTMTAMN